MPLLRMPKVATVPALQLSWELIIKRHFWFSIWEIHQKKIALFLNVLPCDAKTSIRKKAFIFFSLKHFFFEIFGGHSVKLATIISDELCELTFRRKFTLGKDWGFLNDFQLNVNRCNGSRSWFFFVNIAQVFFENVKGGLIESRWPMPWWSRELTMALDTRAKTQSIARSLIWFANFCTSKRSSCKQWGLIGPS